MKIAVLAPIAWRTPPMKYGPWEQIASNIVEGLVERDMEVTLFATGNSSTKARLEYVSKTAYAENPTLDPKVWECLHISHLMEQAGNFDIIHNHFDFLPLSYSRLIPTPMVTTIHGFSSQKIIPVYKKYNSDNFYVSISDSNRSPELDYLATVYNGINLDEFTFNPDPDEYLLFFGRIHPEKGTYEAIQIAKKTGRTLIISGLIQDEAYYNAKVKPYINNEDILYVGNSSPNKRDQLLSQAFALLHPISFNEPFGLSIAEAMICGTPVIAFDRGSMPELIVDNETGFLVKTVDQAAEAVAKIKTIARKKCRDWATSQFSRERMIDDYITIYEKVLSNHQS